MDWDGIERRASMEEPKIFRWVEALGPALVVIAGGGMAYGGIQARMDAQAESLQRLQELPIQIATLRTEVTQAASDIRVDHAGKLNELGQRIATVEQRSQRSYENIQRLWEIVRANQGKLANVSD